MKKTSLRDIAAELGVSTALVSYVLNNKKEGRINKEVAERIRQTARRLNYRANQVAKSLKTNRTLTIGLLVADIANPFFSSLARVIERAADAHGYTVLFGSSDEQLSRFEKLIDTFLDRQVDGLIIAPPAGAEVRLQQLVVDRIPFVLIDRYFPSASCSYVAIDNFKAAEEAVNHLINAGRRRIGLVTLDSSLFNLQDRTAGYLNALMAAGIAASTERIKQLYRDSLYDTVPGALVELLEAEEPVDALLFASNTLAAVALKHINKLALQVPRDLAIISFDERESLDLFYAPLSYVDQPVSEMGTLATELLLEQIGGNREIRQVKMNAILVLRESTDPAR